MATKCNSTPPCRPAGIGPSCWARVSAPKDSNTGTGSGLGGGSGIQAASNGEPVTTLPDNVKGLYNEPCCDDCGDTGDTGDGGTSGVDGGGIAAFDPLQDGFTTEDLEPDPGAESTNECIAKLRKKLAQDLQNCICNCFAEADGTSYETDAGGAPYCWGKCMQTLEADFSLCYCRTVICGGKQDLESGDTGAADKPSIRYDEAESGPTISELTFPDSTYDRVIPLVYNRGIVVGNVIWASDERVVSKCVGAVTVDPETNDITVSSTRIRQTFIDLAVGVSEGALAGISRIWIDDKLVYNNTLDPDDILGSTLVVENIGLYNREVDEIDKYDRTLMELKLYLGTEDQAPDPTMGTGLAHRGLAYIVFKNFELTSFNGNVPTIRVEAVKTAEENAPWLTSEVSTIPPGDLDGIAPDFLYVDRPTRRIYTGATAINPAADGDGVRMFDYDTLEFAGEIAGTPSEPLDYRTFALSKNATTLVMQSGASTPSRPAQIVTPDLDIIRATYGAHTSDIEHTATNLADTSEAATNAFITLREQDGSYAEYFVGVNDNDIAFLKFATPFALPQRVFAGNTLDSSAKIRHFVQLARDTSIATDQEFTIVKSFDFYFLSMPSLTQNTLTIHRGVGYQTTSVGGYFDPAQTLSEFSIDAEVWGGFTSGVDIVQVVPDHRYQSLFIFLSTGAIIRWDAVTESVIWVSQLPTGAVMPVKGSVSPESSKYYCWIGSDSVVYRLNKLSGTVVVLEDLVWDSLAGAQYYDAAENSITYISSTGEIARTYIGRVFSGRTPLREVLYDLLHRAGYYDHEIDVDAVTAYVDGYVIDTDVTLRSVLEQLSIIYDVTIRQSHGQIYATMNGDASTALTIDLDAIEDPDYSRTIHVDGSEYVTSRVTYFDTDLAGGENVQVVSNAFTPGASGSEIAIAYPFTGTAEFAAALAERILYDATINNEEITIRVGQRYLKIAPGDYIIVDFSDMPSITYYVKDMTIGADKSIDLELTRKDTDASNFTPAVAAVEGNVTNDTVDGEFTIYGNKRPFALATNAIVPSHAQFGYSNTTSLYGGVLHNGDDTFDETTIFFKTASGGVGSAGTVTEAVIWGTVITPPSPVTAIYSTDKISSLVIQFANTVSVAKFVSDADLFDAYGKNTLFVNGELIQFKNWSVAPDGKTVTFTNLLRGRHGTEQYVNSHVAGGIACFYTPESLVLVSTQMANPDGDTLAVAVRVGLLSANEFAEEPVFVDHDFLKFFGPSNIHRTKLVTGDIVLAFNRRNRVPYGNELDDIIPEEIPDVTFATYILSGPYNEAQFLADVDDIPSSTYIKRVDTGTVNYTVAQQVLDGFDNAVDTLHIVVFQTPPDGDTIYPVPRGHPTYRAITPSMRF